MSKTFHLAHILSITTGRLFQAPNTEYPIDCVYQILDYMTNDNLYTHQLGRVAEEVRPYLFEQFAWAKEIDASNVSRDNWTTWFDEQMAKYGEWHEVNPMHLEDHTVTDPLTELQQMAGAAQIVVVDAPVNEPSPYGNIDWKSDDGEAQS